MLFSMGTTYLRLFLVSTHKGPNARGAFAKAQTQPIRSYQHWLGGCRTGWDRLSALPNVSPGAQAARCGQNSDELSRQRFVENAQPVSVEDGSDVVYLVSASLQ